MYYIDLNKNLKLDLFALTNNVQLKSCTEFLQSHLSHHIRQPDPYYGKKLLPRWQTKKKIRKKAHPRTNKSLSFYLQNSDLLKIKHQFFKKKKKIPQPTNPSASVIVTSPMVFAIVCFL